MKRKKHALWPPGVQVGSQLTLGLTGFQGFRIRRSSKLTLKLPSPLRLIKSESFLFDTFQTMPILHWRVLASNRWYVFVGKGGGSGVFAYDQLLKIEDVVPLDVWSIQELKRRGCPIPPRPEEGKLVSILTKGSYRCVLDKGKFNYHVVLQEEPDGTFTTRPLVEGHQLFMQLTTKRTIVALCAHRDALGQSLN